MNINYPVLRHTFSQVVCDTSITCSIKFVINIDVTVET